MELSTDCQVMGEVFKVMSTFFFFGLAFINYAYTFIGSEKGRFISIIG